MSIADGENTTHLNNLELSGDLKVDGEIIGNVSVDGVTLGNGDAVKTDTTNGHTGLIQAYDVDGAAYKTFLTLTNGNTPSAALAAPSGGTLTVDGATIGGTAPATLASGNIVQSIKRCSGTVSSNGSTALANVTGLSFTVVPGTYKFRCNLQGVADGTGGIKYALNYTGTVLSSLQATSVGTTASASATQSITSTTTQALLFDQAAAVLQVVVDGTMVVTTGGTIDVQVGLHANSGTSTTVVGSTAEFVRIA